MESFLKNPFQNPFGGAMNPSGGGGGGVLEQIQEQVNTNGETLQSLQGGIGGIGGSPFVGATQNHGMGNMFGVPQPIMERPGPTVPEGIFQGTGVMDGFHSENLGLPTRPTAYQQEGMPVGNVGIAGAATDIDAQLRAEYDELVASAQKQRDEGFMGRVVLPGENLSFEEFKTNQPKPGMPFNMLGGPMQSDLFNIAQPEQNPGMDYSQFAPTTGNLYTGELNGSAQTLDNYVPTDLFGVGGEQGFFNQSSLSEPPRLPTGALRGGDTPRSYGVQVSPNNLTNQPGLDPLFGRAFAGKPV